MTLTTTQARPNLEEVLELDRLCLGEPNGRALDMIAHRERLEQALSRSEWGIVRSDDQLVAYTYLWPIENADWFVGGLVIHPRHRTAPAVTALSQVTVNLLEIIGAHSLKSHVLRDNIASLRLHKRLGFKVDKESETAIAFSADCAHLMCGLQSSRRRT